MKKIDLHIHTVPVEGKDADFDFDLTTFQKYVVDSSLDAIAITNHNIFDLKQFNKIIGKLKDVSVFPGIEIDFEKGHLLLIAENSNLEEFDRKCSLVMKELENAKFLDINKLKEIFGELDEYILIPHYDKDPKVNEEALDSLKEQIFLGEVSSPKRFNRLVKNDDSLVPVLFSDSRITLDSGFEEYQGRHTFIKTNSKSLSISNLKAVLRDRNKVFLSNSGKRDFFQISNNGQELSNGLNVVLGGRSSGKTHLLDQLSNSFGTDKKSIKYIQQFDLIKDDAHKFNKLLEKEKSTVRETFLKEFRVVVESVLNIDRAETNHRLEKYIESLLEFASSQKLHDEYSNAALFKEIAFPIRKDPELEELIRAVFFLKENKSYKTIINRYIPAINLNKLSIDLEAQFKEKTEKRLKKEWVNELVQDVCRLLKKKTASPVIKFNDIDFYDLKIEKESVVKFNAIANKLKKRHVIEEDPSYGKFKVQAVANEYSTVLELYEECGKKVSFAPAFKKYEVPIEFLEALNDMPGLEKSELYKYFCKITYQVLNKFNKNVSGGERAEFNLLKALQDARQYEMLLIDEPESSFDNLFLKESVNKEIKDISKELPVVVVTHNNTVGMLLHPDYILYTRRDVVAGQDEYKIFSGSPGDKEFETPDTKEKIESYDTLLNTLEAGEDSYADKATLYKSFKK